MTLCLPVHIWIIVCECIYVHFVFKYIPLCDCACISAHLYMRSERIALAVVPRSRNRCLEEFLMLPQARGMRGENTLKHRAQGARLEATQLSPARLHVSGIPSPHTTPPTHPAPPLPSSSPFPAPVLQIHQAESRK